MPCLLYALQNVIMIDPNSLEEQDIVNSIIIIHEYTISMILFNVLGSALLRLFWKSIVGGCWIECKEGGIKIIATI